MASVSFLNPSPKPPDPHDGGGGGFSKTATPQNHPTTPNASTPSFANVVAGSSAPPVAARRPFLQPRFPQLALPTRQVGTKEGRPAISFTSAEVGACEKRFEFSLIAKFTVGRPSIPEIQSAFQQAWHLAGRATISEIWDGRHIFIILDSEADVRVALSSPLHKIGHAFFRLFRWTSDYNPKKESKFATIWVRLTGLPLALYDSSFVEAIVSTFGYFVAVDERTKACVALKYARACVELDVTQPIPDSVWISLPNDKGFWQPIDIETKLSYCNRCKVHGHSISNCRKAKSKLQAPLTKVDGFSIPKPQGPNVGRGDTLGVTNSVSAPIPASKPKETVVSEQWVKVTSKMDKRKLQSTAEGSSKGNPITTDEEAKERKENTPLSPENDPLAMVVYSPPKVSSVVASFQTTINKSAQTNRTIPVSSDGPTKSSSPEMFYDEKIGLFVHPNAKDHYESIQKKAGSVSPASVIKNVRDRLDLCKIPKGSKHCLSNVPQ